jgi:hypothetical protein
MCFCVCYYAGQVVHNSSNVISFAVVAGNGRLAGTHNGRVTSHGSSAEPTIAVRGVHFALLNRKLCVHSLLGVCGTGLPWAGEGNRHDNLTGGPAIF